MKYNARQYLDAAIGVGPFTTINVFEHVSYGTFFGYVSQPSLSKRQWDSLLNAAFDGRQRLSRPDKIERKIYLANLMADRPRTREYLSADGDTLWQKTVRAQGHLLEDNFTFALLTTLALSAENGVQITPDDLFNPEADRADDEHPHQPFRNNGHRAFLIAALEHTLRETQAPEKAWAKKAIKIIRRAYGENYLEKLLKDTVSRIRNSYETYPSPIMPRENQPALKPAGAGNAAPA